MDLVQIETTAVGVCQITLNDERRRNALSLAMLQALCTNIEKVSYDSAIRVIVIAATGPVFSSGHDLKEITSARQSDDRGRQELDNILKQCATLMQTVVNCPKPVIAKVDGIATAAGCQLVASCDLAFASEESRFCTPGVNIGLFCSTPMVALSRNLSNKNAMEMLLTGQMVGAERAAELGLINRAVAKENLDEEVHLLAEQIASKSSMTVAVGKKAFYRQMEMSLEDAYSYTSEVMLENMLAADAEEGIGAFLGKRTPEWTDR